MNDTPCPICNFLLEQRRLAFIKREYAELARYENEHEAHRAKCEIINSSWYRGLWQDVRVLTDEINVITDRADKWMERMGEDAKKMKIRAATARYNRGEISYSEYAELMKQAAGSGAA